MKQDDEIVKRNGKIIKFKCIRKPKSIGSGSYILLPKQLVGKEIYVELMKGGISER